MKLIIAWNIKMKAIEIFSLTLFTFNIITMPINAIARIMVKTRKIGARI